MSARQATEIAHARWPEHADEPKPWGVRMAPRVNRLRELSHDDLTAEMARIEMEKQP
jgi:hypothetical protein